MDVHRAARLEDVVRNRVNALLRRRGWSPQVLAYTGYGCATGPEVSRGSGDPGTGWVRVLARVLLANPDPTGRPVRDEAEATVRGWRSFVTAPVPSARVRVRVGDRVHEISADRGGYVDAVLGSDLPPGRRSITVETDGATPAEAPVVVVGPEQRFGIVSDIDDTVMVTVLPRPFIAAWNTFVLNEQARRVVPGMADLYRNLLAGDSDAPVLYLSTGAWNVAPTLTRFLARGGYPDGPLLLTDWGPTNTGWFRSGQDHKRTALHRLSVELPQVRWLLVGDDGQHDPDIYSEFARRAPDHVRAVAIRELSPGEQVLAHGTPVPIPDGGGATDRDAAPSVPTVGAADGKGLAWELQRVGVLVRDA